MNKNEKLLLGVLKSIEEDLREEGGLRREFARVGPDVRKGILSVLAKCTDLEGDLLSLRKDLSELYIKENFKKTVNPEEKMKEFHLVYKGIFKNKEYVPLHRNANVNDRQKTPRIFISHYEKKDSALALTLSSIIVRAFPVCHEPFVSSHNLIGGDISMKEIRRNLQNCDILITLCSPESAKREWISIEIGAAWVNEKKIIPILIDGFRASELPGPSNWFHAISMKDKGFEEKFVQSLSKILKEAQSLDYTKQTGKSQSVSCRNPDELSENLKNHVYEINQIYRDNERKFDSQHYGCLDTLDFFDGTFRTGEITTGLDFLVFTVSLVTMAYTVGEINTKLMEEIESIERLLSEYVIEWAGSVTFSALPRIFWTNVSEIRTVTDFVYKKLANIFDFDSNRFERSIENKLSYAFIDQPAFRTRFYSIFVDFKTLKTRLLLSLSAIEKLQKTKETR